MIVDEINRHLFIGDVEEAKSSYPGWFLIRLEGLIVQNGSCLPVLQVFTSTLPEALIKRLYGRRVELWTGEN